MADRDIESSEKRSETAGSASDLEHELNCSSCGASLVEDELFERYRVCPSCGRHFPLPARERLALLVDPGTWIETNAALVSADPLVFRDQLPVSDRLAEVHARNALADAVITGIGAIGGQLAVLVVLDFSFHGSSIGLLVGEKIALAMECAAAKRLPLIAVCSGGGARTRAGSLALFQIGKTAAGAARLRREGIPILSVLTHPTTGGIYVGLANQADLILAERGAQIGFGAAAESRGEMPPSKGTDSAETLLTHGMIDAVVDRTDLRAILGLLLDLIGHHDRPAPVESVDAAPPAAKLPWEAVDLARHRARPAARAYIERMCSDFIELHGDRVSADDPTIVGGLGHLSGIAVAVIGQERAGGEAGRRPTAAGYRKAARIMRLAGQLGLPVITLVDAPGQRLAEESDEPGLGMAITQTLNLLCMLPVPVVSVVIGEHADVAGLALGLGDRVLMQQHAISSMPGRDLVPVEQAKDSGRGLILTARDCLRLGVIDGIVPEPAPAAHADPERAAHLLAAAVTRVLTELPATTPRRLLDARERRLRTVGLATPEGQETAWREMTELQRLQRAVARSLDELREGWEARNRSLPKLNLNLNLHRPDLTDLAGRFAALKEGAAGWRPDLTHPTPPTETVDPAKEPGEEM